MRFGMRDSGCAISGFANRDSRCEDQGFRDEGFGTIDLAVRGFSPTLVALAVAVLVPLAAAPERVRIAAVVTDRQGRTVPGLTLKDFELRVDGVVQHIESVEARGQAPRRIAILLDEFHVDASDAPLVRDAVSAFVSTRLRADDMLVVLKPLDPLAGIRLTNDRSEAIRAIAAFGGRNGAYEPRTKLEEETMGSAPALVESGRAQVVLSALRALAAQLGAGSGRSAILRGACPRASTLSMCWTTPSTRSSKSLSVSPGTVRP